MLYLLLRNLQTWLESIGLWKYLQVFVDQPTFRAVASTILAFAIVVLAGKRVIRWLLKQKIGDNPEFYHADLNQLMKQKSATPTMGGLLVVAAIALATILLADITEFYIQMALLCLILYAGLGAADDWLKLTSARRSPGQRDGLRAWEKFLFQVGWALVLGFFIHHHGDWGHQQTIEQIGQLDAPNMAVVLNLPFQRTWMPGPDVVNRLPNPNLIELGPWAFGILTVLIISGFSNATNLTDGMDGLVSGIMGVVAFAFLILCLIAGVVTWAKYLLVPYVPSATELSIVAGAMVGACLGFLWFNCHPAQVFMGDTGSLPLGALIGYIAVVIRQEVLLILVGGVLVFETLSVMLQVGYFKASRGSRLFRCAPVHHHFHLSGWSEQQVVVRFWLVTALLAAVALATIKLR